MISTTLLLQKAWDKLFCNKQSLLHMIWLSIIPGLIVLIFTWAADLNNVLLNWYNFQALFKSFSLSTILLLGVLWIILFIWFMLLSLVCSYLSLRVLANNFKKKQESLPILLSHWKKSFDYLRLWVATSLYIIGWCLIGLLSFILMYFDATFAIPSLFIFAMVLVYAGVNLSLTSGIFFFEDITGFNAIKTSKQMIQGRWWTTLVYILVLVAATILIVLFLGLWEYFAEPLIASLTSQPKCIDCQIPSHRYFLIGFMALGGLLQFVIQLFLKFYYTSYIFTLYQEFKKTSVNK